MVRPKKVMAGIRPTRDDDTSDGGGGGLMVQSRSRRTIKPNPKYNSKEIVPLKRMSGAGGGSADDMDMDDNDSDHDESQHTEEDDDDFQDDGAKDSDIEETPPSRRRGRPRTAEAPRSEPPPQNRGRLQQIRAGLKEVTMSASKIMQQSAAAAAALEKKRKIDYDGDGESDEPSAKRRGPGMTTTPISTRGGTTRSATIVQGGQTPKTVGKENSSTSSSAATVKMVNVDKIKNAQTPINTGVATRRQQQSGTTPMNPRTIATTTTPSPRTASGIVRSQVVIGSAAKDTPNRSMIQVRRATPMTPTSPVTSPPKPQTNTVLKQNATPINQSKDKVILNRSTPVTTVNKPKTNAATLISTSPSTPASLVTRSGGVVIKSSPSPLATATRTTIAPGTNNNARILNATPSLSPMTNAISKQQQLSNAIASIPVGTEIERVTVGDKIRVTTMEKRFIIRMIPEEDMVDVAEDSNDQPPINLLKLRSQIKQLKMPNSRWSYQMKLQLRKGQGGDTSNDVPEKPGYQVHSVVLNRLVPPPAMSPTTQNGQKVEMKQIDRSVELLKNQYNVTIDGKAVKLIGAPDKVTDKEEVETLLQIVDSVTIGSPVVKAQSGLMKI